MGTSVMNTSDVVLWIGDLNYRIDHNKVEAVMKSGDYTVGVRTASLMKPY